MMRFLRKRSACDGLVSIGFAADGVSLARVSRRPGSPPVLDHCDFEPGDGSAATVSRLGRRHRIGHTPCSVLVGEDDYSLLLVDAPEVPPEELRAAVRWRLRDLIDFHVDDAVIDVFDLPVHKVAGRPRSMYVVAARTVAVGARIEALRDAGLDLGVVDIPELAQRNVAVQLPEDAIGVALLALSADSGLVTLTRQGVLYLARRLELGLDALGDDMQLGDGEPGGRTRDWMDALLVQLQRSLDFFESNFAQPPISKLVLAPMRRRVPGLVEYLAAQLGLQVRELDLNELIDSARPLGHELQAQCFAAIGAALRDEARPL